ncbi:MAG: CTP synthase [Oscillospiraceae bacterium]|nr:CTP synthase [Oscillospiraceae bacterium]
MTKYIFVTGGVCSGLGKGITAASLGRLLKQRGLKVLAQKLDPYMNIDPGMMNPLQHGEVFVTDDGTETDLDLGHYERFIDENLSKFSSLTSGKVYSKVLNNERDGAYFGATVQIIPHVTSVIKKFIISGTTAKEGKPVDVLIVEIGGTVGDIESQPFLETIRQISIEKGRENCLFIHVTLVPYMKSTGEHKSKPTQHSVKELRIVGIAPDIIVTRSDEAIDDGIKEKIALFCNVKPDCVIENRSIKSLYEVPLMLHDNGLDNVVCRELSLNTPSPDLDEWQRMVTNAKTLEKQVNIAIVGKYYKLRDAYISIIEALIHAGIEAGVKVNAQLIDSETLNDANVTSSLEKFAGIIVPDGFGVGGVEGIVTACRYAREKDVPLLGICLGMQVSVIEFARNVCGLENANSCEVDVSAKHKVIDVVADKMGLEGNTFRRGAYTCKLKSGTMLHTLYGCDSVDERHRHMLEFNNSYREELSAKGLVICGETADGNLVEAIELPDCRFYAGVQFHPEFKSRPNRPHPLFSGFIRSCVDS